MQQEVENRCSLVQYADDSMIFKSIIPNAIAILERKVQNLMF